LSPRLQLTRSRSTCWRLTLAADVRGPSIAIAAIDHWLRFEAQADRVAATGRTARRTIRTAARVGPLCGRRPIHKNADGRPPTSPPVSASASRLAAAARHDAAMSVLLFTVATFGLARLVLIQRRIDRRGLGCAVAVSFMGRSLTPEAFISTTESSAGW
jgi:hypothetical protein